MNDLNSKVGIEIQDYSLEFSGAELVLIQRLKLGNFERDEELRAAFVAWVDQNMAECAKDPDPRKNSEFLLKKAKFLFQAGFLNEAWADLFDLRSLAENLGQQDLVDAANTVLMQIAGDP